jgi:hypothetical protein
LAALCYTACARLWALRSDAAVSSWILGLLFTWGGEPAVTLN